MKKFLAALALMAPGTAFAGFGATAYMAPGLTSDVYSYGAGSSYLAAPSLDYRQGQYLVQVRVLDLIGGLVDDPVTARDGEAEGNINFGAAFSAVAFKRNCAPEMDGVIMPGATIHYFSVGGDYAEDKDSDIGGKDLPKGGFALIGESRFGFEMKKGFGFGVYVVPMLGFSNIPSVNGDDDGDDGGFELAYGGGLEVSAWIAAAR
jgi:hypothetical protein